MFDRNDAVAGFDEGKNRRGNGSHATGETQRILAALKLGQHLLEGPDRRIETARIDRANLFATVGFEHFVIAGKGEERGLYDGWHDRIESVALVVGDGERGKVERIGSVDHLDISLISSSTTSRILSVSARAPSGS